MYFHIFVTVEHTNKSLSTTILSLPLPMPTPLARPKINPERITRWGATW